MVSDLETGELSQAKDFSPEELGVVGLHVLEVDCEVVDLLSVVMENLEYDGVE